MMGTLVVNEPPACKVPAPLLKQNWAVPDPIVSAESLSNPALRS